MFLRLRIRPNEPQIAIQGPGSGYRIRPASFGLSLGLHALAVTILFSNPLRVASEETTQYRDIIQPQAHKIIFYSFRQKLPEVAAARKEGRSLKPKGTELSRQTIIASSPNAKSDKQFIWQPFPKIEVPRDLPLPNLIARANIALPPPPPSELRKKPQPPNPSPPDAKGDVHHAEPEELTSAQAPRKAFVPPPLTARNRAPIQAAMMDAPDIPTAFRTKPAAEALAALKLRKAFLPPPPQQRPVGSTGAGLMAAPAPNLPVGSARGVRSTLPEGLGSPSFAAGIAPPPNVPMGTTASTGNGHVDIAIAGLHPAGEMNGPLPDGARPGRFAKAPELGEPAGGDGSRAGALTVPDLSIHEDTVNSAPLAHVSRRAVLYAETVRSIPVSTLSVPLRPSSRTIPAAIDGRFQGRSVYTMVVPIENLPAYGGDWILWFAERDQKPGDAPSMHAPVPFRKLEPVSAVLGPSHVERRVQVAAVIKQDGTVDHVSLVGGAPPAIAQAVIQDLQSWEFKPATRSGTPVDVDVVVEIPFNLSVELATAGSK